MAFGWHSQPGFAQSLLSRFENYYSRAYDYAKDTAWPLANVIHSLTENSLLANHPIDIFTHSLGSRVVIRALALAAKHHPELVAKVGRVVILGGAEYVMEGQLLFRRLTSIEGKQFISPGNGPEFYNIISRENDVLDKLAENFGPMKSGMHDVLGHNGLCTCRRRDNRWMDLQIDSADVQDWFEQQHQIEVSGDRPYNVWDHWYYYTWPGNMEFYTKIFRKREEWSFSSLRQGTPPIPEVLCGFTGQD